MKKIMLLLTFCLPFTANGDITHETLKQLHRGMSYSEVCAILGRKGDCSREETPEGASMICSFTGDSLTDIVTCRFENNRLVNVLDALSK
jgi:hypothetical protein